MMTTKYIKIVTVTGIILVIALQLIWMNTTYNLTREEQMSLSYELLKNSLSTEFMIRLRNSPIPADGLIVGDDDDPNINFPLMNEAISKLGVKLSLSNLDSIYRILAVDINFLSCTSIVHKSENYGLIESFPPDFKPTKFAIFSEKLYIRTDRSEYLQVVLVNPFRDIFGQMSLLLIATIIMVLFVAYCISYQIAIIIRQNRIAQLREDFSNAMIHDMKTPLTSIMIGTRMLQSGKLDENTEKRRKFLRIMEDEVNHLLTLANKVLILAKLEKKGITLDKQLVAIKPVIDDLVEKFSVKSPKQTEFRVNILIDSVYADPEYLKEIFINLIDNAIKYSGLSVIIEITATEIEGYHQIKVKDNGFGISPRNQVKIFEKFERADASRRSSKGGATGFGLGLNYVQQVLKAHDGHIYIESIEGEYSEFTINLPKLMEDL